MNTPFNPGEVAEFAGPIRRNTEALPLFLHDGMPEKDGWYLVELEEDSAELLSMPFGVVYCRAIAVAPGGVGHEWVDLESHHIKRWAKLPEKA